MNENGFEKEKVLMMLTEISMQLEKLEESLESSFTTVRKDLYAKQIDMMHSVGNRLNSIDKKGSNSEDDGHEHPSGALKLELGF